MSGRKTVFTIKPAKLSSSGGMSVEEAARGWEHLRNSIEMIYKKQSSKLSYEEVYRYVLKG